MFRSKLAILAVAVLAFALLSAAAGLIWGDNTLLGLGLGWTAPFGRDMEVDPNFSLSPGVHRHLRNRICDLRRGRSTRPPEPLAGSARRLWPALQPSRHGCSVRNPGLGGVSPYRHPEHHPYRGSLLRHALCRDRADSGLSARCSMRESRPRHHRVGVAGSDQPASGRDQCAPLVLQPRLVQCHPGKERRAVLDRSCSRCSCSGRRSTSSSPFSNTSSSPA